MTDKIPVPEGDRLKDIEAFARLGATNSEIAAFLEVSISTLEHWLRKEPDVQRAISNGKMAADAKVLDSFYRRARGFEKCKIKEQKQVVLRDSEGESRVEIVDLERELPPDAASAIFWLKNRRGWRDRVESVNFNLEAKADLTDILTEYARRHGLDAAKRIAEDHGFKGTLIEGESEVVESPS